MSNRKCFSLAEKAKIVKKAKEFNGTNVDLAKSSGITYLILQTILKQKASVLKNSENLQKNENNLRYLPVMIWGKN